MAIKFIKGFSYNYIWSDYGDEIIVDKETKLVKWNPAWQKMSQPVGELGTMPKNTIKIKRYESIKIKVFKN